MATIHEARHVKAVAKAASTDPEHWSLQQVRVNETRLEASDGKWLLRVTRDRAPKGELYQSAVAAAGCKDVCKGAGVERVEFDDHKRVVGLGEQPDEGGRGSEIVMAPIGEIQESLPNLDEVVPPVTPKHRRIHCSPRILASALTAMAVAGADQVTLAVPRNPKDPIIITGLDALGMGGVVIMALVMPLDPERVLTAANLAADSIEDDD